MKNILIIGGSYFAGRVFVETLYQSGQYQLSVFNRGNIPIGLQGVTQLLGDRENAAAVAGNIPPKHWHVIVDFCAYTPEHISILLDNLQGTVGHYIFLSTTSIYAPTRQVPVIEEAAKLTGPQPELGAFADYGYLKWLAECKLEERCRQKGISFTMLRPAIIYGRYNYAPRESYLFDTVMAGKPLVIPDVKDIFFSFVWVNDLGKIIAACLENEAVQGQAFNVAGEEPVSYAVMADVIEAVSGLKVHRRVASMAEILRERISMPFPPDESLLYDGSKLRQALNHTDTPFIRGMAKTWQYYQKVVQQRAQREKA